MSAQSRRQQTSGYRGMCPGEAGGHSSSTLVAVRVVRVLVDVSAAVCLAAHAVSPT